MLVTCRVVRFKPTNLTTEQYEESIRRIKEAGAFPPDGCDYHIFFGSEGDLQVSEVWDSREKLEAFGERLMPILAEVGIEFSGPPEIFVDGIRMALAGRIRRSRPDLRNHRRARSSPRRRARRENNEPAGCAPHSRQPATRQSAAHAPRRWSRRLRTLALRPGGNRPRPRRNRQQLDRVTALASGIVYASFCIAAVRILTGSKGSSSTPKTASAGVFGWPAGTWIVGAAGLIVIGVGLYQGYRGITRDFLKDSKTEQMSPRTKRWISRLGLIGHLSRMVVFTLVGVFLVKAAVDYNPRAAIGLDGALAKLQHNSLGPLLLGVVALGLIAFALYSFSDARYRRI